MNSESFFTLLTVSAAIAAMPATAQTRPFSRTPFTASLVEEGSGKVIEYQELMRSDGSWVGKSFVAGAPKVHVIHDVQNLEMVTYDAGVNAHYVLPLSKRQLAKFTTRFDSCAQAAEGFGTCTEQVGTILGYSVDKVALGTSVVIYRAPALNYYTLRQDTLDAQGKIVSTLRVTDIKPGEPDEAAFTVPAGSTMLQVEEVLRRSAEANGTSGTKLIEQFRRNREYMLKNNGYAK